jgi:molecular chaperone DnaK
MGKIIGIDLGTTNSLVAVMEGNRPVIIKNNMGTNLTSSAVKILPEKYVVGNAALRGRILDPEHTVTSIKRFIGRKFNEVFDFSDMFPYRVVPGTNDLACVLAYNTYHTPQAISAAIITSLKESAQEYLGEEVSEAVITVPAYFSEYQKTATREAGELAGLKIRRIIMEPTAAALAYGLDKGKKDQKVAVFDLGGGTFDISILELGDGVFEVKSTSGDGFLGGDDFDEALMKWAQEEIFWKYKVDCRENPLAAIRIREAVQKVKHELSFETQACLDIPFFSDVDGNFINIAINITRSLFEDICEELFERLVHPCEDALKNANLNYSQIDSVILVGGATRMPKISQIISAVFYKEPLRSVNPDEAVALGAAIQGAVLTGYVKDILLLDVTSRSLGLELSDGRMFLLIPSNTIIPTKKSETFHTSNDGQTSAEINILEGEDQLAINNRSIGRLVVENLSPLSAGKAEIEVIFDIDQNGILDVTGTDKSSGHSEKIRISVHSGFTKEDHEQGLPEISAI